MLTVCAACLYLPIWAQTQVLHMPAVASSAFDARYAQQNADMGTLASVLWRGTAFTAMAWNCIHTFLWCTGCRQHRLQWAAYVMASMPMQHSGSSLVGIYLIAYK